MLIKTGKLSRETEQILRTALKNRHFTKALKMSTGNNPKLAEHRLTAIAGALENLRGKTFAATGTWNFPNFGTVLELASVLALVTSFSGYLTVERALAQPNAVEYFLDIASVEGALPESRFPAVGQTKYSTNNISNQVAEFEYPGLPGSSASISFYAGYGLVVPPAAPPSIGHVIVPYTLEITLVITTNENVPAPGGGTTTKDITTVYKINDDGRGRLLLPNDLLNKFVVSSPSLNYGDMSASTPSVGNFQINIAAPTPSNINSIVSLRGAVRYAASYVDDRNYPGVAQLNDTRFRFDLTRHVEIRTKPSQLVVEWNLVDLAQSQKSLNVDLAAALTERITDLYTKIINRYITEVYIRDLYNGRPENIIDISAPIGTAGTTISSWDQYPPVLSRIAAEFESVYMNLYTKSFIGAQPTAMLVSPRMLGYLRRMKVIDPSLWTDEKSSYINNLQGYFRGIPVLVHSALADIFDHQNAPSANYTPPAWLPAINVTPPGGTTTSYQYYTAGGFVVHVRDDASLAPAFHGIFLPPTEAPVVSNFANITQQARGIYFMQEVVPLAHELVTSFAFVGLPTP